MVVVSLPYRGKIVAQKLSLKSGISRLLLLRVSLSRFKIFMQLIWWILRQLSRSTIPLVPGTFNARSPIFLSSLYSDLRETFSRLRPKTRRPVVDPETSPPHSTKKPPVPRVPGWVHSARYTAISRKVVGKSARDNPKGIEGGFEFTVLQRNLREWHERPWRYVCEC